MVSLSKAHTQSKTTFSATKNVCYSRMSKASATSKGNTSNRFSEAPQLGAWACKSQCLRVRFITVTLIWFALLSITFISRINFSSVTKTESVINSLKGSIGHIAKRKSSRWSSWCRFCLDLKVTLLTSLPVLWCVCNFTGSILLLTGAKIHCTKNCRIFRILMITSKFILWDNTGLPVWEYQSLNSFTFTLNWWLSTIRK